MSNHRLFRKYFRTTRPLLAEFEGLMAALKSTPPFDARRYALSQEVVANALWLWTAEMDPAELAGKLAPYVARAEAILDQASAEAPPSGTAADPAPTKVVGGAGRKGGKRSAG